MKEGLLTKLITFLGNNALGIYIFHLILMIVVGACFPSLYDLEVHPLIAILIAIVYTVISATLSELIRRSCLGILLKL
jgi:peptidoglycan/LPS O-acetylase OafA/YrhL